MRHLPERWKFGGFFSWYSDEQTFLGFDIDSKVVRVLDFKQPHYGPTGNGVIYCMEYEGSVKDAAARAEDFAAAYLKRGRKLEER